MPLTVLTNWLKERTELNLLDEEILDQIVPHLQSFSLPANEILVTEKESVKGLYILRSGHLERLSQKVG
ncbi:MAG: cyclic nucleotide-binding domain-containing protein, partial [Microcystaceae cyanobacterium]